FESGRLLPERPSMEEREAPGRTAPAEVAPPSAAPAPPLETVPAPSEVTTPIAEAAPTMAEPAPSAPVAAVSTALAAASPARTPAATAVPPPAGFRLTSPYSGDAYADESEPVARFPDVAVEQPSYARVARRDDDAETARPRRAARAAENADAR